MGQKFIDQYSLLHLASGIIAYFFGLPFKLWFVLHLLFELAENTNWGMFSINQHLAKVWPGGKPYQDSILNSISDQIFASIGWLIAYYVDRLGDKYKLYDPHIS